MRGKIVFAAVAAGIALATSMAAPAYADDNDSIFISVLDDEGIPYTKASDAILVAKGVCVFLKDGNSLTDATVQVMKESGLGAEQSGFFVGAATAAYCPSESP
jgi:hypothetical protein